MALLSRFELPDMDVCSDFFVGPERTFVFIVNEVARAAEAEHRLAGGALHTFWDQSFCMRCTVATCLL